MQLSPERCICCLSHFIPHAPPVTITLQIYNRMPHPQVHIQSAHVTATAGEEGPVTSPVTAAAGGEELLQHLGQEDTAPVA